MYCKACGTQNDDNAFKCVKCGEVIQPGHAAPAAPAAPAPQHIPDYLAPAILVTLFCCLPFGIVAIVFASQVNGKIAAGDMTGAIAASNSAKLWTWLSFGIGLGVMVLYLLLMFFGVITGITGR